MGEDADRYNEVGETTDFYEGKEDMAHDNDYEDETIDGQVVSEPPAVRQQAQAPALAPAQHVPAILQTFSQDVVAGVSMVPLTETERAALMADQPDEEFEIHPYSGQVYLGNSAQRRLLNSVVGPGQWGLVPRSELVVTESKTKNGADQVEIAREYALYVRGHFVSAAWGACNYIPSNDSMTRADAIEGARSDALKKNLKDLGVAGNQAFSAAWRREWIRNYARRVKNYAGKQVWKTTWDIEAETGHAEPAPAPRPASRPAPAHPAARSAQAKAPAPQADGSVPEGIKVSDDRTPPDVDLAYVIGAWKGDERPGKKGPWCFYDFELQPFDADRTTFKVTIPSFKTQTAWATANYAKDNRLPVLYTADPPKQQGWKADLTYLALDKEGAAAAVESGTEPAGEKAETSGKDQDDLPF